MGSPFSRSASRTAPGSKPRRTRWSKSFLDLETGVKPSPRLRRFFARAARRRTASPSPPTGRLRAGQLRRGRFLVEEPGTREQVQRTGHLRRLVACPEELPLQLAPRVRAAAEERERRRPAVPARAAARFVAQEKAAGRGFLRPGCAERMDRAVRRGPTVGWRSRRATPPPAGSSCPVRSGPRP